jgi:glycosyltransferase involved in cell wall biosynthesis
MEAWQLGRPVAVHASCLATAAAVRKSGGGWLAEAETEWAELFTIINRQSRTDLAELGHKGFEYAKLIADWGNVLRRYEEALESSTVKVDAIPANTPGGQEIHQVLPNMAYGDAISNQALFIRAVLRAAGYVSNIYVRHADPNICHESSALTDVAIAPSAGIIYHHSIGTELTPRIVAHPGPKFLIYHNITPDAFYEPYRPQFAEILRTGREELSGLARHFLASAGDSKFNSDELNEHGFRDPTILPIAVDPLRWEIPADPKIMSEMQDGQTNILFVGRIAANKKQDDLIDAFEIYLRLDPEARLVLVGLLNEEDPYASYIRDLIESRGLGDSVKVTDCVNDGQLAAYYRSAHLFWSMSEHEGFGVPLVEAMWFDIPVLAFKSSAVPETLGEAGFMFTSKTDMESLAALAHLVVTDRKLREAIITAQRQRRLAFLPEEVSPLVLKIARELVVMVGSQ